VEDVGRLKRITGPGLPAYGVEYDWQRDVDTFIVSDRIASVAYKSDGDTTLVSTTRNHDLDRPVLMSVENRDETGAGQTISKYTYAYDGLRRRTSVVNEGTAFPKDQSTDPDGFFNLWRYNSRGELTGSWRGRGTTVPDNPPPSDEKTAERRAHTYDNIGNRKDYTSGTGSPLYYCTDRKRDITDY